LSKRQQTHHSLYTSHTHLIVVRSKHHTHPSLNKTENYHRIMSLHASHSQQLLRPRPYRHHHQVQHLHPTTSYRSSRPSQVVLLFTLITLLGLSSSSHTILPFVDGKQQQQQQQPPTLPVVGILSQPSKKHDHSYHYIATSYVDWIEGGDETTYDDDDDNSKKQAITIPIPYDASPELLDELFTQINGLLLPGGWNGYMPPSVPYLLDKIVESNENGVYFPVWGTCLGYEFLIKYIGGIDAIQTGFDLYNTSIPLESVHIQELYDNPTIYEIVTNLPVTLNNHQLGIEPDHFLSNPKLTARWNITSINYDVNDRPFVSSIEPIHPMEFPFYGVQYHPEKNAYENTTYPDTRIPYENIDHTPEGIEFSYYMSNFFIEKVRYGMEQQRHYHGYTKMNRFPPIRSYTSSIGIKYEDIHIIPYASHWMTTASSTLTTQQQKHNNQTIMSQAKQYNNHTTTTSSSQAIINISKSGIIDFDTTNDDASRRSSTTTTVHYNNEEHQLKLISLDDDDDVASTSRHQRRNVLTTGTAPLIQQAS
jgi:gamma-glutamyl hydrolase